MSLKHAFLTLGLAFLIASLYSQTDTIYLDEAGAIGNGKFDNAPVFDQVLGDHGDVVIVLGAGSYFVSRPVIIRGQTISVIGQGIKETHLWSLGTEVFNVQTHFLFENDNYPVAIEKGTTELNVKRASGIEPGAVLHLHSPEGMPETRGDGHTREYGGTITSVRNGRYQLSHPVDIPFNSNIRLTISKKQGFNLSGMTLSADSTLYIMKLYDLAFGHLYDLELKSRNGNLQGQYSDVPERGVSAIAAYGCQDLLVENVLFNSIWYGLMGHNGCYNTRLTHSIARNSRHINNCAIGSDFFVVDSCTAFGCNGGFDSHETGLGTTFINCRDLQPKSISKFRGRRDTLIDCYFEGHIELRTDIGIWNMYMDEGEIAKIVKGCTVKGNLKIAASNTSIERSTFHGTVNPYLAPGRLKLTKCGIHLQGKETDRFAALTLGGQGDLDGQLNIEVDELTVTGTNLEDSPATIGVYVKMSDKVFISLDGFRISGFEKGLVIHGPTQYFMQDRLAIARGGIRDCGVGVSSQKSSNTSTILQLGQISIENCTRASEGTLVMIAAPNANNN